MKTIIFAKRNFKEIIRDPISLVFAIGLPLFLLIVFQQFKIPSSVYNIENFAPSIIIFSFSFITLFTSLLISKDRTTSFLTRLFSSPLSIFNYIIGYSLSIVPISIIQSLLFLIVSSFYGLSFGINIILTVIILIPISLLFVSLGIFIGCLFNDKQSPAITSLVIQLVAFTSGMWFDSSMLSNVFETICRILPFKYAVDIARSSISGDFSNLLLPIIIILGYTIAIYTFTFIVFKKQMKK